MSSPCKPADQFNEGTEEMIETRLLRQFIAVAEELHFHKKA
ncbi:MULTISPECIES: hypothetical protein [Pseudomonas]|jgi:hypothetical protein|nr:MULTISPECIES: hypothetical protein [Pseudomonas]